MPARRSLALVVRIVVLVSVAGCSDSPAPTVPGDRGPELLYEGYVSGIAEAFRIDTTGATPTRVLPEGTIAMDPTPSPDGSRLAFVVANYVDGTGDIYVVNRDGTGLDQITESPELDDSPSWSPDGQRLVFRSYQAGYEGDIWIMDADGSDAVNLTPTTGTAIVDNRRPDWSPDGLSIVYASTRGGDWGIWLMPTDGGEARQLTNTIDLDAEPACAPDSRSIAFRRSDASGSDIMLLALGRGEPQRIPIPGEQRLPAWSPDGQMIAFVGQPTLQAQAEIYVMRANGTDVKLLTTNPAWGGGIHPAWRLRD